jgi:3-dehydroquinate dehydratase-2
MATLCGARLSWRHRTPVRPTASMSILILRGPHAATPFRPTPFPDLDRPLRQRARAAGQALHCRAFASVIDLLAGLRHARRNRADMLLLDIGDLALHDGAHTKALRDALDGLPSPYIEVHDDAARALEPRVQPQHAPLVTVILRDDLPRAYAMALDIALRRLDRAPAADSFHA